MLILSLNLLMESFACSLQFSHHKVTRNIAFRKVLLFWLKSSLDIKGSADENLRRHIISLAYAMKWRKLLDGVYKIDMDRVNAWCIESGFGKKPLYEYTHNELPELVSQFKKVYEHHIVNI